MINILIERVDGCPFAIALLPTVIRNEDNEYKEGEFILEELVIWSPRLLPSR